MTAALTFSTNVVLDFALGKAVDTYQYAKFVDASRQMTTLPVPKNDSGPKAYQAAMKVLAQLDAQQPLWSRANADLVRQAIGELTPDSERDLEASTLVRQRTLLALLHFVDNNYPEAGRHAHYAYRTTDAIDATDGTRLHLRDQHAVRARIRPRDRQLVIPLLDLR